MSKHGLSLNFVVSGELSAEYQRERTARMFGSSAHGIRQWVVIRTFIARRKHRGMGFDGFQKVEVEVRRAVVASFVDVSRK